MSRKKKLYWLFWTVWLLSIRLSLNKADTEIENGNFVSQDDVEVFFEKRRQSI
jgi:hypothetical protein